MRIFTVLLFVLAWFPSLTAAAQVINGETPLDDTVLERQTPEPADAAKARAAAGPHVDTRPHEAPAPGEPTDGRRD